MSVSTLESAASRRDRAAYFAEQDAIDKAEHEVREEIETAFTHMLPRWAASSIAIPTVDHRKGVLSAGLTTADAVIRDRMEGGYVHAHLLAVLEKSECPYVQKLREAIGKSWADQAARDVAPYRAGVA